MAGGTPLTDPALDGFKGVFPANPTPIGDDGAVNEAALRAILEDNTAHGVNGFWLAGSTGEGPVLTEEQREAVARVSAETCRGKALTIMHVGAISTASAVAGARAAARHGCDAISCLPPFLFRTSERAQIDHYKAVADAADGLPFFVYNLPQLTQVETAPPLMEKYVREVPTIVGLKHSSPNFPDIRAFADMGLRCFTGNSMLPLPALTMGAVGVVDAPPSVAPWVYVELYRAWVASDMPRAMELQASLPKYVDLVRSFGAPSHVCKVVLSERVGIDCGEPVPPITRMDADQKRQVLEKAEALGVTKTPVGV